MIKKKIRNLNLTQIRSEWYEDIIAEWQPNQHYINYLKQRIQANEYIPPILVVCDQDNYVIVNGHHRFYAHLIVKKKKIQAIILKESFADTAPLREAEVLLKQFDQATQYRYRFSGYLDRWASSDEDQKEVSRYHAKYSFHLPLFIKKIAKKLTGNTY